MAAISQIVDDRIEQLRKERAELDELRVSLERKEAELLQQEQEQTEDIGVSDERKESLLKEIENLTTEVKRLRAERDESIENFGGEMSKVHAEKTAQKRQLQSEIAFLTKGKTKLEEEIECLQGQASTMDENAKHDLNRILEEKELLLARTRAERETSLKEINLAHSMAITKLDCEKKELENEISVLLQNKTIEWNKIHAEISRYKTAQLAEIDASRASFLAELEKDKAKVTDALRVQERKQLSEISAEKRAWDKKFLKLQTEKQNFLDEISLLEYNFEKTKSENILKIEKARVDEAKMQKANRAEALAKTEDEKALLLAEFKTQAAEQKNRHRAAVEEAEKEIAEYQNKKAAVFGEITALEVKFDQQRAENDVTLESLRLERLQEIEQLRQERIAALEKMYLEKTGYFENARAQKLEEINKLTIEASGKLSKMKVEKLAEIEKYLETYRTERLQSIQEDIARQSKANYKQLDKLAVLNDDYNKRMTEIQELSLKLEADNRNVEFKNQQISLLQQQNNDMTLHITELEPLAQRLAALESKAATEEESA